MKKWLLVLGSFIVLFSLGTPKTAAQDVDIITNGGFEDATLGEKTGSDIANWVIFVTAPASAVFEVQDAELFSGSKALQVDMSALATNAWDVQVVNDPFNVTAGATYTYSIMAKADQAGPLVNFTVGNPAYSEFGRLQGTMTTDWQEFTFTFTPAAPNPVGRAPIHLGEAANSAFLPIMFFFDDLRITGPGGAVAVGEVENLPTTYALGQNYPNPFNPTTNIKFDLPVTTNIHLYLVNLMGQTVKEIAHGPFSAGSHRVSLDASGLTSGVYFYRLDAGNFSDVKKLMLMK